MKEKEYKFLVSMCGGWCNGTLSFYAKDEEEAYNIAMGYVGKMLSETFPELDILYDVELLEEDSEKSENEQCCETCMGWESDNSLQNTGVCIRYAGVTRKDDCCDLWHGYESR